MFLPRLRSRKLDAGLRNEFAKSLDLFSLYFSLRFAQFVLPNLAGTQDPPKHDAGHLRVVLAFDFASG